MTLGESFVALFASTDILTVCLWAAGFVLFVIEFFQPMHGVAYSLGGSLMGASFITRMLHGSAGEAFVFVLLTAVLLFGAHVAALAQKKDWLRVAKIERANTSRKHYGSFVGSIGIANTAINLMGNATINDVNLVVCSETPIEQGERVIIVKVTPNKIMVERADIE